MGSLILIDGKGFWTYLFFKINVYMKTTQEWLTFRYKLSNKLLTVTEINLALIKFNNLIFSTYSENQFILIIFKIRTDENIIRSISTLQWVNKLSINDLKNVYIEYWALKADNYLQFNIEEIILNYKNTL